MPADQRLAALKVAGPYFCELRHVSSMTLLRRLKRLCALSFLLLSLDVANAKNADEFFKPRDQLALATAAAAGRTADMEASVRRGANVNFQGVGGMTALIWAVGHESKEGVSWLLNNGADPNLVYAPDGNSCVTIAAMEDDPWFLKEILAHGGNPNYQNPINKHTPLMNAIVPVHPDNAKALLAVGADPNTFDHQGYPALFNAAANQRFEMVYDMLQAGADPTFSTPRRGGNALVRVLQQSRAEPGTPLYEWLTKVKYLLKEKGLDVDTVQ
jgi:ankyrin repeat protein